MSYYLRNITHDDKFWYFVYQNTVWSEVHLPEVIRHEAPLNDQELLEMRRLYLEGQLEDRRLVVQWVSELLGLKMHISPSFHASEAHKEP